ncbi:MAG TPA: ABC transporter permease [Candidatus Saccharimonadales bacterium]|jgi:ABC-2 type transport system permease protein|nr:ABC transporter permease [Candidatus Saccharimonadales bacterium]
MVIKKILSKRNRALLRELVVTDFKLRYQGSILGYAWSLLRPLLLFCILYVVFVKFLRLGTSVPHYPIYLLLGIVLWSFFTEMTNQSLGSVVARGDLIRKIRIPRWIIVVSSSVSALINLALNLIVVGVFMAFNGIHLADSLLWFPLVLVEIYVFALGLSLILAAAFVKYRDISPIWEIILQALFYLTPILYPITLITNTTLQKLILLNPAAQAIQDARNFLVTKDTVTIAEVFHSSAARLLPIAFSLLVLLVGVLYFKKEAKYFAENI